MICVWCLCSMVYEGLFCASLCRLTHELNMLIRHIFLLYYMLVLLGLGLFLFFGCGVFVFPSLGLVINVSKTV